jgi:hypothetical protein
MIGLVVAMLYYDYYDYYDYYHIGNDYGFEWVGGGQGDIIYKGRTFKHDEFWDYYYRKNNGVYLAASKSKPKSKAKCLPYRCDAQPSRGAGSSRDHPGPVEHAEAEVDPANNCKVEVDPANNQGEGGGGSIGGGSSGGGGGEQQGRHQGLTAKGIPRADSEQQGLTAKGIPRADSEQQGPPAKRMPGKKKRASP